MKVQDAKQLEVGEILQLQIGEKVWYPGTNGDLVPGIIVDIVKTRRVCRRTVILADLVCHPVGDIQCFIINENGIGKDGWQISPTFIHKAK